MVVPRQKRALSPPTYHAADAPLASPYADYLARTQKENQVRKRGPAP
jgi:hypothetical protein